jgi:hypothetical protein
VGDDVLLPSLFLQEEDMRCGNIVARSPNHCCNVNAPLPSVCVTDVQVTVNNNSIDCRTECFNDEFMSPTAIKHSEVFMLMLLSAFNEICSFSTDFRKIAYIKFHGRQSSGCGADTCGRADGHEENRRFSR